MRVTAVLAILTALSIATSAVAQEAEDWEFVEQGPTTAATVAFDNGLAVIVRCQGESLETYVRGLSIPSATEGDTGSRVIDYAFGDAPLRASSWQVSENGQALFADVPAPMARRFREGGPLQMRVAANGADPARRYVIGLPASRTSIDRVLSACGRERVDPRDLLRYSEASTEPVAASTDDDQPAQARPRTSWRRQPQLRFPDAATRAGAGTGMAVLSCLADENGALDDCRVEVERPAGVDFGRFALRAARDARLNADVARRSEDNQLVTFTVRWRTR